MTSLNLSAMLTFAKLFVVWLALENALENSSHRERIVIPHLRL